MCFTQHDCAKLRFRWGEMWAEGVAGRVFGEGFRVRDRVWGIFNGVYAASVPEAVHDRGKGKRGTVLPRE